MPAGRIVPWIFLKGHATYATTGPTTSEAADMAIHRLRPIRLLALVGGPVLRRECLIHVITQRIIN